MKVVTYFSAIYIKVLQNLWYIPGPTHYMII